MIENYSNFVIVTEVLNPMFTLAFSGVTVIKKFKMCATSSSILLL